ncbi:hypothetical protein ASPACDRAFT_46107 [Aspergillus aculeatus ATCC 16872]|uniref:Cytochrome P450 n=1 Tax=Aspergillus aculeatus (strain ATCC 16872 / CBS 172.66 / WB 5094) TaxID=690307 RepID=A0A1L9WM57_ASPA1|nr:uncharacterized protein ASPACDRAFT_46107 [Aspergillus aculeatus ATCC 16872]OJJ97253.1 hypothetical protein ASPACDRAFT_46107 [Aspergillus aculeatus ATCC 16872]
MRSLSGGSWTVITVNLHLCTDAFSLKVYDIFAQIHETLGQPPVVLFDYRPIYRPVLVIASHEVAEQISRPSKQFRFSVPKLELGFLEPVIGHTSILAAEGEAWKALRKTFNPWFSPQNLQAPVPTIVEQTRGFITQLDALAGSGAPAPLVTLTTNLMYEIIGAALLDEDLGAQHLDPRHRSPLVRAFNHLIHACWDDQIHLPWFFHPVNALRRLRPAPPAIPRPAQARRAPERWVGVDDDHALDQDQDQDQSQDHGNNKAIPPSAWRPYERGPRASIGQEFARLVMRVILAVVGRRYVFTNVGLGAVVRARRRRAGPSCGRMGRRRWRGWFIR